MTHNFHIPLRPERQAAARELQGMLVDLLDLTLIGKHAHWNVEGRLFRSVHRELDDLIDASLDFDALLELSRGGRAAVDRADRRTCP